MNAPARHILTVNLEDYFQVGAFNRFIQQNRWRRFESRVEFTTDRALELLAKHQAKATFFVLGWIADQFPHVVRKVADAGHEVGVRGYFHRRVQDMTPDEFKADVIRARNAVEQATGKRVYGYRVADGWFGSDDLWALDALADLGFAYDSSIAPMGRAFTDDPRRFTPHEHHSGDRTILELPVSTGKVLGVRVPVAGGNYLRQLPRWLTRRAAARWVGLHPTPLLAYFHTWELDVEQPKLTGVSRISRLRHYRNLSSMPDRIGDLLRTYRFGSAAEYLELTAEPAPQRTVFPASDSGETERATLRPIVSGAPRTPISIVVPCYNEELLVPHLKNTLDEVRQKLGGRYEIEFVLVDDGSTDQTWNKMRQAFGTRPDCLLLRHDVNEGVAAAIMTGLRGAHNDTVCSMDSDCSYDPLKLAEMIPQLTTGVDLVTASPYHPAGAVRNVPGWRLGLSKGCAWMYRRVLKTKLHTYTSCFRVYRRSTVAAVPLVHGRYLGIAEIIGRLDLAGKTVVEYPAVLESRMIGRSKMKTVRTVLGHLGLMVRLVWDRFRQDHSSDRDQVLRGQLNYLHQTVVPDLNPDVSLTKPGVTSPAPISPVHAIRSAPAAHLPTQ
jgi:polysaccharide deacetylase family protein (PEP-CTERM system associated)